MAKRKGEKYKRIKCSTLAKLMNETQYEESIYNLNGENQSQTGDMDLSGPGGKYPESVGGLLEKGSHQFNDAKSQHSQMSSMTQVSAASPIRRASCCWIYETPKSTSSGGSRRPLTTLQLILDVIR